MKVLVFAPHNDDEVLGVGGTIARLAREGHKITVCEATSGPKYEMMQREAREAHKVLGASASVFLNLPVNGLRNMPQTEINQAVAEAVNAVQPDLAFLPHQGDMHTDHSALAMAAMVALRPVSCPSVRRIYAYETLSETEWNTPTVENAFLPNTWVDISSDIETKLEAMRCYRSQLRAFPHPRSEQAILALARLRGSTVCVPCAEAFMLIRGIVI